MRALAVVAVLAYHAHYPWAVGGYLGVDVFFVLSGFLITRILLKTERSWRGYRTFLVRRAVRLVPALLVATAGMVLVALLLGNDQERGAAARCSGASVGYVMNLPFAERLGCPAMWHVTWSLAAEQQFYLVWPILLAALTAVLTGAPVRLLAQRLRLAVEPWRRRWLVLAAVGCTAFLLWVAAVVRQALLLHHGASTTRVVFAPDGRSLVLLLGCALALLSTARRTRSDGSKADLGAAAALVVLTLCLARGAMGSGPGTLVPLVAGALAAVVLVRSAAHAPAHSWVALTLGAAPVAWLGRVSYSLYLWHEVAFRVTDAVAPHAPWTLDAVRFGLALALAAASYHLVEQPVERWWRRRGREVSRAAASAGGAPTARTHSPHRPPSRHPRPAALPSTQAAPR